MMDPTFTVGFVIMMTSTLAFYSMSLKFKPQQRVFHHITMFVTGIAATAYLIMAFDGGKSMITLADGSQRKFYYVRYGEALQGSLPTHAIRQERALRAPPATHSRDARPRLPHAPTHSRDARTRLPPAPPLSLGQSTGCSRRRFSCSTLASLLALPCTTYRSTSAATCS